MESLSSHTVITNYNSPPSVYQSGGNFKMEIPQSSVMMAKPLSYEFRVVEYVEYGKIVKVGLQYQVWEHENYGAGNVKQSWTDVKRVRKDVATGEVTEL